MVRFGVEVPKETDRGVADLADVEGRPSKRNMHAILINRVIRIWKDTPEKAIEMGLVKPEQKEA